jgi:hypothetical protein
MSRRTTRELKAQARILATLPTELSEPARGIPHFGLMPTGADVVLVEAPIRSAGALRWSYFIHVGEWISEKVKEGTDLPIEEIAPWI